MFLPDDSTSVAMVVSMRKKKLDAPFKVLIKLTFSVTDDESLGVTLAL